MSFHFLLTERDHKQDVDSEKDPFRDVTACFNIEPLERNALGLRVCNEMSPPLK
jgi:hypothetical protein